MNDVFENLRNWLNKKDKTNTNYKTNASEAKSMKKKQMKKKE